MDIIIYLGLFIVSIIPAILLYKWIKGLYDDKEYKGLCKDSFVKGLLSVFPIILVSAVLAITGKLIFHNTDTLLYKAYYTFFVLAFAEELIKFLTFKKVIKNKDYKYTWFSLIISMTLVGLGFGCIENTVMAIGSNVISMAIRAISMGHAGYGFIMGWFYGKMIKTKKKIYGVLGFLIPWILHGLYDFGLTDELLAYNDNFAFLSVTLELVCIIMIFVIIKFIKKRRNDKDYTKELSV